MSELPKDCVSTYEVINMLGISRSHLQYMVRNGKFPQPIRVTKRTVYWNYEEVLKIANERYVNKPKKKYIVDSATLDEIKELIRRIENE